MTEPFAERRRTPRTRVSGRAHLERTSLMSVRLLDIGWRGLLLVSSKPIGVGECGHLTARLGDVAIEGDIEIVRVNTKPDGQGYHVGARFVSLDATPRHAMQQFLAAARR